MRGDAKREIERRLSDREGVAGVEADSHALVRLAELDQFVAAEILVVLDRKNPALVECARTALRERAANGGDKFAPAGSERMAIAAKNRGQTIADRCRAERAGGTQRALERAHCEPGANDRRHAQRFEPVAEGAQVAVA